MIPPQLALLAAKHWKKIVGIVVICVLVTTIRFAFAYHERVVEQNAQLRGELASTELARTIDAKKMEAQAGAIQQWKESHDALQATLQRQEQVSREARGEKRKLNEIFRDHELSRLAAAKPTLVERAINRGTSRIQRLLVCASSSYRCDDDGHPLPAAEAEPSTAESARAGAVSVGRVGTGALAGPGRGVLLRRTAGLRGSRPQPGGDLAVHPRDEVATRLLSEGSGR